MLMFGEPAIAARRLRALADDLDKIAAGQAPSAADLAGAPTISRWRPELNERRQAAVSGIVSGDPLHADGTRIWLDIVAVDPDVAWILSLFGWYLLGPAEDELEAGGAPEAVGDRRPRRHNGT